MARAAALASSANASFSRGCAPLQGFGTGIGEGSTTVVCNSSALGLDKLRRRYCSLRDGLDEPAVRSCGYVGLECMTYSVRARAILNSRPTRSFGIWQGLAFGPGEYATFSNSRNNNSRSRASVIPGVNGAFWEGADSESAADFCFPPEDKEGVKLTSESLLLNMVQAIEPLDVSIISKDASSDSTGAMKRTISGMLGLLPSDQFHVTIETSRDHLARLLVSSMMTGYTLRNAEYRLSLQRTLELSLEDVSYQDHHRKQEQESRDSSGFQLHSCDHPGDDAGVSDVYRNTEQINVPKELGALSSGVANYIQHLREKLSATSKELEACRLNIKNAVSSSEIKLETGLATKNDLLDYLRSLEPEKVAELSQPSKEVQEAVDQVVAGLLGTMVSKPKPSPIPPFGTSSVSSPWEECGPSEVIENIPLQCHSTVTSSRDYLARLLFWLSSLASKIEFAVVPSFFNWCTLLGYYMRGLEYRLELSRTLSLSGESVLDVEDDKHDTWSDWGHWSESRS